MQETTSRTGSDDRLLRYALVAGIALALICGAYLEENWRGRHEWNKLKCELEARGGRVDWTNYIPVPVPAAQNFLGIPQMQRWFVGRGGNDLTGRLATEREKVVKEAESDLVARITVVKYGEKVATDETDVILDYDSEFTTLTLGQKESAMTAGPYPEIIPLIVMDEVPLSDAIKNLAKQFGWKYELDAKTNFSALTPEPTLSCRWEKVTAKQALRAVFKTYNLRVIPNSKTGVAHITATPAGQTDSGIETSVTDELRRLLEKTLAAATNDFHGRCAYTSTGMTLAAERIKSVQPVRVVVRSEVVPATNEIAAFFPALTNAIFSWVTSRAQVEALGGNSFGMRLSNPGYVTAAEYLRCSDAFKEDFDAIREALKRPYAQLDGDFSDPVTVPIPNFISQRVMAQTLTDRAKCHLLLGQSAAALEDLTLVRDLCSTMEGRPRGRATTLVATMIDSAITGLYVQTIAEGMRLRAWREPELAALQEQLKQIDLPPMLAKSFEFERASCCRVLETVKPDQFINTLTKTAWSTPPSTNFWDKLKNPTYLLLRIAPHGWVYQNMSKIARLDEKLLSGLDLTNRQVSPAKTEKTTKEILADLNHFSPYNYLANEVMANFIQAVQHLARSQSMADQALIACALERHRLAHGRYPDTVDVLVPQFLEKSPKDIVNGQPLKYRLKADGEFVLYSVGWNEKDDGGVPGPKKDGWTDVKQGDWVWAAPSW